MQLEDVKIIQYDLEVAWNQQTIITVTWIPYGDPNERPRVCVFEYHRGERRPEAVVIALLSHTWVDTREQVVGTPPEYLHEIREFAVDKSFEELNDGEDW